MPFSLIGGRLKFYLKKRIEIDMHIFQEDRSTSISAFQIGCTSLQAFEEWLKYIFLMDKGILYACVLGSQIDSSSCILQWLYWFIGLLSTCWLDQEMTLMPLATLDNIIFIYLIEGKLESIIKRMDKCILYACVLGSPISSCQCILQCLHQFIGNEAQLKQF